MNDPISDVSLKDLPEILETLLNISSRLEIQQVLNEIVKQADILLNAQGSTLAVAEPETSLARVVALHNVPFEYDELLLSPSASASSHVITTGEPLIVNDLQSWIENHPENEDSVFAGTLPYDAILAVPLIWENKVMGSLTVVGQDRYREFNHEDEKILNLIAHIASSALNNAQLYSQVVQLNQQLESKVEERTSELELAQNELEHKAEQLKRLLGITVFLQEEERARIARDLHDSSNQLITGSLYEIQAALESLHGNHPEVAVGKLQTAKELLKQVSDENRQIINDLRPPVLDTHGLVTAIKRLAHKYQDYSKTLYKVDVSGQPVRLPARTEITIYRIVQESFNNITTYAKA